MPIPTHYITSVLDIDPTWFRRNGIETVLLDLDNTLLPRDTNIVPAEILSWSQCVTDEGVRICLVSNNWHERAVIVADQLGYPLVKKAVKPLPFAFIKALGKMNARRKTTVVIGDQFFTDVVGGTLMGMKTIMVLPLAQHDLWHTLMLRHVEKVVMGHRQPQDGL